MGYVADHQEYLEHEETLPPKGETSAEYFGCGDKQRSMRKCTV